jgi:hypothetical protein
MIFFIIIRDKDFVFFQPYVWRIIWLKLPSFSTTEKVTCVPSRTALPAASLTVAVIVAEFGVPVVSQV